MKCPNCGKEGPHYVPPSLGEKGFFACAPLNKLSEKKVAEKPAWLSEIRAEQEHGRQKYGAGPNDFKHDDDHARADWPRFIIDHAERAVLATHTPMEWRQRMVKIAGLAISAIESFDRQRIPDHYAFSSDPIKQSEAYHQSLGDEELESMCDQDHWGSADMPCNCKPDKFKIKLLPERENLSSGGFTDAILAAKTKGKE